MLSGLTIWTDKSSSVESSTHNITKSSDTIQKAYTLLATVCFIFWSCLMAIAFQSYGFALDLLWRDIWVEAGPSVAFMTIDTGVLYLGALLLLVVEGNQSGISYYISRPGHCMLLDVERIGV